jgi:hypothetical protein
VDYPHFSTMINRVQREMKDLHVWLAATAVVVMTAV